MAWQKLDSTTLTSSADSINSTISSKIFNQILIHIIQVTGAINVRLRVDGATTDYAYRRAENGTTDVTSTETSTIGAPRAASDASDKFIVWHLCNISGEEKLGMGWMVEVEATGAGTAPYRGEFAGKRDITTGQVTVVNVIDEDTGAYNTDSNQTVLGTD